MPRGQYDRAAAKAKRDGTIEVAAGPAKPLPFLRPAWPYTNPIHDELQAKLDAANALIDRYKDLVKRNGLWLDE